MTDDRHDDLDRLTRDLTTLVARLLERSARGEGDVPEVGALVRAHLGDGATSMPLVAVLALGPGQPAARDRRGDRA